MVIEIGSREYNKDVNEAINARNRKKVLFFLLKLVSEENIPIFASVMYLILCDRLLLFFIQ